MRSIQLITGTLAVVATSGLIGLGHAATAAEPTVTHERGIAIECSGTWKHQHVYALVYENSTAGNTVQVVVNDGEYGAGRDSARAFRDGRQVRAAVRLDGRRAVIEGTARVVGRRTPVHEELEDAGQLIVADGHHRRLATDLDLTWRGRSVPLDCDGSFRYALRVTKTPIG